MNMVEDLPLIEEAPVPPSPGSTEGTLPGRRPRRRNLVAAVCLLVAALLAGLGVSWAARPQAATPATVEARTDPAVVDVVTLVDYGAAEAEGTGIVLTSTGLVLTNNHVIEGATSVQVTDVGNGTTYRATVVGYDATADLALIQLQGASGLTVATLGDSSKVLVGEQVTAIGNAGGVGGTPSAATGAVTALDTSITAVDELSRMSEQLTGLIETDAPIVSGDSGGPLVDSAGKVIGLDVAASSGFQFQGTSSTSFAIPINGAVSVARQVEQGRSSSTVHVGATAFLGVEVGSTPYLGSPGATVVGVVQGTPADAAGLEVGDVITSLDGRPIDSSAMLSTAMQQYRPGDHVAVSWLDQTGQQHTASLVLASGPAA
jgi:S1-C subfamily serine protease